MKTEYRRLLDSLNYFGTVNNFSVKQEYESPPHYEIDVTPYDLNPYDLKRPQTITWNTSPDARVRSRDNFEKLNKACEEINRNLTKSILDKYDLSYIDTDMVATKEAFKNYILEGKKMPTKTGNDQFLFDYTLSETGYRKLFGDPVSFGPRTVPQVKKIIHSGPCTVVFWEDNTKTIVRLEEGKEYDEYAAFTAALAKKVYGNNSKVHKILETKTIEQRQKSKKKEDSKC